jgi:hypothetical protein
MIAAAKTLPWRDPLDIELDELADFRGISISRVQPALVNSNDESCMGSRSPLQPSSIKR